MNEENMLELADAYIALRDEKNLLQAQMKGLQERIDEAEAKLIEVMTTEECSSFKRGRALISLAVRENPGPVPEMKDELWKRMKEHGFESLFTINSRTLSSTVKELKQNNDDVLPDWLEGLISVFEQPIISIRKS